MLLRKAQWVAPVHAMACVRVVVRVVLQPVLELAKTAAVVDASGLASKNCFEGVSSLCHTLIKMKIIKI